MCRCCFCFFGLRFSRRNGRDFGFNRRRNLFRGLLGLGDLLDFLGLCFDDRLAAQTFAVAKTTDAIGLRVLNAGRVALDPDAQFLGQIENHLVVDAELAR